MTGGSARGIFGIGGVWYMAWGRWFVAPDLRPGKTFARWRPPVPCGPLYSRKRFASPPVPSHHSDAVRSLIAPVEALQRGLVADLLERVYTRDKTKPTKRDKKGVAHGWSCQDCREAWMPNAKPVYAFVAYYESSPKKENSDGTYLRACPDKATHEPRPPATNLKCNKLDYCRQSRIFFTDPSKSDRNGLMSKPPLRL